MSIGVKLVARQPKQALAFWLPAGRERQGRKEDVHPTTPAVFNDAENRGTGIGLANKVNAEVSRPSSVVAR